MADGTVTIELDLDSESFKKDFKEQTLEAENEAKKMSITIENSFKESSRGAVREIGFLKESLGSIARLIAVAPPIGKGLFGTLSKLTFLSGSLLVLAESLEEVDSQFAKTTASALKFSSVAIGALTLSLGFLIDKISGAAFMAGTTMVGAFKSIAKESNKLQASNILLNSVIENFNIVTGNAIGTTKEWSGLIGDLSQSLNLTQKELNKSAQEIISVGSQLGLTSRQLKELLVVSAEYAKINKKEVFPVTLAIVKAMAGNSQAVQALGIKLNQASVANFAYGKGLKENFNTLKEGEKVQFRYSKLIKQFGNITGIAAIAAGTLADQENALNVSVEKINKSFGQGVAKIENLNIVSAALARITGFLNESFVEAAGTFSALGARILQVTGFIINLGLKVFLVAKAFTAFKILMDANNTTIGILQRTLPILNTSFLNLFRTITFGTVSTNKFVGAFSLMRVSLLNLLAPLTRVITSGGGMFSIMTSLASIIPAIVGGLKALFIAAIPLLAPFALFAAKITAVVAAITTMGLAFKEVEERTSVFSATYQIMLDAINETVSIFSPAIVLFRVFGRVVTRIAKQAFGLLVAGISKAVSVVASIVAANPFGVFSDDTVAAFSKMEAKLDGFTTTLAENNFILQENIAETNRAIAGSADHTNASLSQSATGLLDMFESITIGLDNSEKTIKRTAVRIATTIKNTLAGGISGGIQNIVNSIAAGENAFKNFGKFVINTMGDMAIQLGTVLIGAGLGVEALKATGGGAAIAAGAGLVAVGAIMKAFAGGGGADTGAAFAGGGGAGFVGGGETDVLTEQIQEEERLPETNIAVNIQGDVLDSDESSLRIVDLINEAFDKTGAVITRGAIA